MTDDEFVTLEGWWTSTNQPEEANAGLIYYENTVRTDMGTYLPAAFKCGPKNDPEDSKQVCYKYLESTYVEALNKSGGDIRAYLISNCAWTEDVALRTLDVYLD